MEVSTFALTIISLALVPAIPALPQPKLSTMKSYDGYKVYRLHADTTQKLDLLQELYVNDTSLLLDFWHPPSAHVEGIDVMVSPAARDKFLSLMAQNLIAYQLRVENLQDVLNTDEESRKFSQSFARDSVADDQAASINLGIYHGYAEIVRWMKALEQQYSNIVQVFDLNGRTWEGQAITAIKISNRNRANEPNRPIFWLDGGIHAREWIAPAVTMFIINELVKKYSSDNDIRSYVDNMDWVIVPVANPDGYEYSRSRDRMWRKNRNPNGNQVIQACKGVDLNRNFDWHFGETGSSNDPCKEIYNGVSAFSEPESRAMRDYILDHKDRIKAYITLHSYAQIWMYPYGYEYNKPAPDWVDLKAVADRGVAKLKAPYGTNYLVDTGANSLYPSAGGSDDWSKGVAGIKFVYLLELRPDDNSPNSRYGFALPESQIYPTSTETWAGLRVIAEEVIQRFASTRPVPTTSTL